MNKLKKSLALVLLPIGLLSCSPEAESSSVPPEYEGDIAFSLPVEAGQVSKWNTTFSVRTSYLVDCDLPKGYRLPDDLYWEYDPGYLSLYRVPYLSPDCFLAPFEPIGHQTMEDRFIILFTYPGETSIALKRGEETLCSLDVRIIDGTVTPLGFEESRIRDYGEADNLLLFVKDSQGSLGYPFIIGDNFYFHYLSPLYPDPDFDYGTEYYVMGLPKSHFADPLMHRSVYLKLIPSLLGELN